MVLTAKTSRCIITYVAGFGKPSLGDPATKEVGPRGVSPPGAPAFVVKGRKHVQCHRNPPRVKPARFASLVVGLNAEGKNGVLRIREARGKRQPKEVVDEYFLDRIPSDFGDAFLVEFHKLVPLVRAEKGCIEYGPAIDAEGMGGFQTKLGPDSFVVIEKWESTDALKAHAAAPHMAAYGAKTRDLIASRVAKRLGFHYLESGALYRVVALLSLRAVPDAGEREFLKAIRPRLYQARARRPPPLTDTKVLTSWNGLMISAFARAGLAFARQDYVERASRAADHLLRAHFDAGVPRRTGRHAGLLEDHSFLAAGLTDVCEVSGDARWREAARGMHDAGIL